ncbi:Uncharacterized protein BM_BM13527 [Brugia malayi]|uniref:Bm13527 n=1 Tax=Brugia malayi TaxID=6279 RepID=A0A0K0IY31_BRUMA|nr:Bm13527 [Brugia malayi]VIO91358.1 Uncharacterized protein BM_BM13527 [Brugia malayi]
MELNAAFLRRKLPHPAILIGLL